MVFIRRPVPMFFIGVSPAVFFIFSTRINTLSEMTIYQIICNKALHGNKGIPDKSFPFNSKNVKMFILKFWEIFGKSARL